MPDIDGIEACINLRKMDTIKDSYILFLTARVEEYSEVAAFESGADDYITKPIKPRALISRINSFYKRRFSSKNLANLLTIGDLNIDKDTHTITLKGKEIFFPKKEFELLYFLARNPKRVYNRDVLLRNIRGTDVHVVARTVDVHIRKIREKIGQDFITTIKGVGYSFKN